MIERPSLKTAAAARVLVRLVPSRRWALRTLTPCPQSLRNHKPHPLALMRRVHRPQPPFPSPVASSPPINHAPREFPPKRRSTTQRTRSRPSIPQFGTTTGPTGPTAPPPAKPPCPVWPHLCTRWPQWSALPCPSLPFPAWPALPNWYYPVACELSFSARARALHATRRPISDFIHPRLTGPFFSPPSLLCFCCPVVQRDTRHAPSQSLSR